MTLDNLFNIYINLERRNIRIIYIEPDDFSRFGSTSTYYFHFDNAFPQPVPRSPWI